MLSLMDFITNLNSVIIIILCVCGGGCIFEFQHHSIYLMDGRGARYVCVCGGGGGSEFMFA